jgi:hypothetical protein
MGLSLAVIRKSLFAGASDHLHGKASQAFDPVIFGLHLVTSLSDVTSAF